MMCSFLLYSKVIQLYIHSSVKLISKVKTRFKLKVGTYGARVYCLGIH